MSDKSVPLLSDGMKWVRISIPPPDAEQRRRWETIVFCTVELFGGANYALIDPLLLERLAAYRDHGQPVGSFLKAVLTNNLQGEYNRATLYHLVAWLYNEFPSPLWGSEEKYSAWITTKQNEREFRGKTAAAHQGEQL